MTSPAIRASPAVRVHPVTIRWQTCSAIAFFVVAIGLCMPALATSQSDPVAALTWGGLALGVYGFGLLCAVGGTQTGGLGLGRWRLGSWILLWYSAAYGFTAVAWPQLSITGPQAEISIFSVLRALWLVGAGITAWSIGYLAGAHGLARKMSSRARAAMERCFSEKVRGPLTPWLLFFIGASTRLFFIFTTGAYGHFGQAAAPSAAPSTSYQQILNLFGDFMIFAVAAAAMRVFRERACHSWATLIVVALGNLTFDALAGTKTSFALTFLAVLISYSSARRKFSGTLAVLAAFIAVIIIVPFTQAYRSEPMAAATPQSGPALGMAPGMLATAVGTGRRESDFSLMMYTLNRGTEIGDSAIIMQRTPSQIGFRSPVGLLLSPILDAVPRVLWPGKPVLAPGYQFNQEYYDMPPGIYTSTAPTTVGDLYRYGGWLPVIAGMFVLGLGVRVLDDACDVRKNPIAILLLLLLGAPLILSEVGWTPLLGGFPSNVFVWLIAGMITFRKRRVLT